uniref:Putative nitrite reductase n=1 Tax=Davidia involucrata TaxID=16924 RepID=A0A5B6Z1U8_DAVIN
MDQLITEFPNRALPVTFVWSRNRRMQQNVVEDTKGFDWGVAVVSTSVWRGVPLCSILGVVGCCWCGLRWSELCSVLVVGGSKSGADGGRERGDEDVAMGGD